MYETVLNTAPCTQGRINQCKMQALCSFPDIQRESGLEECVWSTIELCHFTVYIFGALWIIYENMK